MKKRHIGSMVAAASLIVLAAGCQSQQNTSVTSSPSMDRGHRSLVLPTPEERMLILESDWDPTFDQWMVARRDQALNPQPSVSSWAHQWVEITHYDGSATLYGRPRDLTRTRARSYQAGPGR